MASSVQRVFGRARLAFDRVVVDLTALAIRRLGLGGGNSLPGRLLLRCHPSVLSQLAPCVDAVVVSATNGKTTTASLIRSVLGGENVISNTDGSNMDFGVALALLRGCVAAFGRSLSTNAKRAALEVDEAYLGRVVSELAPKVVAVMNLSRDQLDRNSEVRHLAQRWDEALRFRRSMTVVANADDPLVVYAVRHAESVVFVAGGHSWRLDSSACPNCEAVITYTEGGSWSCVCGLSRPEVRWEIDQHHVVKVAGRALGTLRLRLPGEFNARNALFACAVSEIFDGLFDSATSDTERGSALLRTLEAVEGSGGRFVSFPSPFGAVHESSLVNSGASPLSTGSEIVLMLAKNPAGWMEILKVIQQEPLDVPVVLGLNAEIADGRDTSWIWDVAMEALTGRTGSVTVTGRRVYDLEVRLRVAGVEVLVEPDQVVALQHATQHYQRVLYLGNYTAFGEVYRFLSRRSMESQSVAARRN
ncbi:MAG: MurT ligase domain-containing protein [Acidimicrobiales bacterium]